jgi:vancomycin resistance protein YoaR
MLSRRAPVIVGGVLAGAALLYGGLLLTSGGDIPRNTTVLGVEIGGLPREDAVQVLSTELADEAVEPIRVSAEGAAVTVDPAEAGLSFDAAATVDAAARSTANPITLVARLFRTTEVAPEVAVDPEKLAAEVAEVAEQVDQPKVEGAVTFTGGKAAAVQAETGRVVSQPEAAAALADGYLVAEQVELPVVDDVPAVGAAEVARAMSQFAQPAMSGPVQLRVGSRSVTLAPAQFAPSVSMVAQGSTLVPRVDGEKLQAVVAASLPGVLVAPRDATFRISGGRPVVVPSVSGQSVEPAGLSTAMLAVLPTTTARTATVALAVVEPELTTAEANALGVTTRISTFTQDFPYAPYRVTNIGTAAKRINGTLLLPGEVYSQNQTVLERTAANGYVKGTIIDNGRFREDYGGGVSTITTALWHAAFYAGLERVEQRAHSFFIPRYQAGLEATVSWGNLDLRFRNDSKYGVYIQAVSGRDFVTISIWSTKRYDIRAESGPRTNVRQPKTVYDASARCLPQEGQPGFTIVVTRVFVQNGTVVKREPMTTRYNVQDRVYCRPAPKPTASPTPTPTVTAKPSPTPTT